MLGYVLVVVIAVAAGCGVYFVALQVGAPPRPTRDVDEWKGTETSRAEPRGDPDGKRIRARRAAGPPLVA